MTSRVLLSQIVVVREASREGGKTGRCHARGNTRQAFREHQAETLRESCTWVTAQPATAVTVSVSVFVFPESGLQNASTAELAAEGGVFLYWCVRVRVCVRVSSYAHKPVRPDSGLASVVATQK